MKIIICESLLITKQEHQGKTQRLEDYLKSKYPDLSLMLTYFDENKYKHKAIEIGSIIVKSQNKGTGTKVMQEITEYADRNGYILLLNPSSSYGGNENRLKKFYTRFGFVFNKGKAKNFYFRHIMIRYPKNEDNNN